MAYETWGELNETRDNAVLIFTGLSPSAHAASSAANPASGWWEYMIGPGKALDTHEHFVVCVNSLGSCFGSTGPVSINPATGKPYRLDFPELSIEDIAMAAHAVVESLGINRLRAVIGTSLGGMTAMAYAVHYPQVTGNLVIISGAMKATPFAIAIRSLQREIICSDPAWRDGQYPFDQEPVEGMKKARKLGLISYRSAEEWDERFGRDMVPQRERSGQQPFSPEFQVESYLEANAQKFVGTFDANAYLYLSRAMDWFDLADHEDRLLELAEQGAGKKALVIGVESDILFPLHQQQAVADLLTEAGLDVRYHAFASAQGHDAFLVDRERFAPAMAEFFASL